LILEFGVPRGQGVRELAGSYFVKGLPQIGLDVCTKFGGDWSGSSRL